MRRRLARAAPSFLSFFLSFFLASPIAVRVIPTSIEFGPVNSPMPERSPVRPHDGPTRARPFHRLFDGVAPVRILNLDSCIFLMKYAI
jgi:hypothetical protein